MKKLLRKLSVLFVPSVPSVLRSWNETARDLIGTAVNELTMSGEWLKITPWGEFDNKVGRQKVTAEDGAAMVGALNSFRSRQGFAFRGLPIFVGHPDMDVHAYPDKRRYGRVNELQVRDDGLYGLVAMNNLGKEILTEGHYQFASPAWVLRREGKHVRPVQLLSVGLTNTPQIPGDPWAKNETTTGDPMPQWLIDLLASAGLMKPEGTEENLKTAVNELLALRQRVTELTTANELAKTQLATATNERDEWKNASAARDKSLERVRAEWQTERDGRIARELDIGVNTGRIPQAERAAWNDKFKSDFPGTLTAINEQKPVVPTSSKVGALGRRKSEGAVSQQKLTAINEAVRHYAAENHLSLATNDGYNLAFAGAKQHHPELFS